MSVEHEPRWRTIAEVSVLRLAARHGRQPFTTDDVRAEIDRISPNLTVPSDLQPVVDWARSEGITIA